jgi:hypothetical protein
VSPAAYQRDLLGKLAAVNEQIDGHRAAIIELEHERRRLEHVLRNSGWRPSAKAGEP